MMMIFYLLSLWLIVGWSFAFIPKHGQPNKTGLNNDLVPYSLFYHCDVVYGCGLCGGYYQELDDPANHSFRDAIELSKIFVCQYCIAENAVGLRESAFIFFQDLFSRANDGALFVFTETTHRLWPDLVDQLASGFDVAFVKNRSFQLLIRKRRDAGVSAKVREQCLSMLQDVTLHAVKREGGYTRQTKERL